MNNVQINNGQQTNENQNQFLNQNYNPISNNNNRWTTKFKYHIFNKFKKMVKIINQKKRNEYRSIIIALRGNEDDKIYEVLADVDFKESSLSFS